MKSAFAQAWVKRLIACLGGGFALALTWGQQEGTVNGDFGIAFFQATGLHHNTSVAWHFPWRLVLFLGIGLVIFAAMTGWRSIGPYLKAPGMLPMIVGAVCIVVSQIVM